jgi:hemerythrin superfamily protein
MNQEQEQTRPIYYQLAVKGASFDVFELVRAIEAKRKFSFELASALKYIIRLKATSTDKMINDLHKAIECINREILELEKTKCNG